MRDDLIERGLGQLRECIRLGFTDADRLEADDRLSALRADPRFGAVRRAIPGR